MNFIKKNILFIVAIFYVMLPVDLIPDAIPVIGMMDDTALLIVDLIRRYVEYRKTKEVSPIK